MQLPDLQQRLITIDRNLHAKEMVRQERVKKVEELALLVTTLTTESALLTQVDQVLLAVSSKVLGQSITTIDKLVTAGLAAVFNDQTLEFRTKVDKAYGKTSVEFLLFQNGMTKSLLDSFGGGPLVIAGVLLRMATIVILNLRRLIVLDESLSHLSDEYIPNASALLKKLCTELDFTILFITHQKDFAAFADKHYVAKSGPDGTTFVLDKG